ncbi:hypothetical protein [Bartonella tamiae]|uniref:YMGG-like Gly-zipper domain-containing protein n=1 Tax=Bartonella tamiae Th239 TaxID=1094558 RepID=J0R632_9HYPH|nr:hypothetical protein [Bartonella tamiae]EJF91159.1 hypothetical protein ME5_00491 [Bartonella tamiae Th239]EJF93176.1 hypothetical protein MEG_01390 [Bartonella tamiae Th307]
MKKITYMMIVLMISFLAVACTQQEKRTAGYGIGGAALGGLAGGAIGGGRGAAAGAAIGGIGGTVIGANQ